MNTVQSSDIGWITVTSKKDRKRLKEFKKEDKEEKDLEENKAGKMDELIHIIPQILPPLHVFKLNDNLDDETKVASELGARDGYIFYLYNDCYGGFELSDAALKLYCSQYGAGSKYWHSRRDHCMIRVIQSLGCTKSSAKHSRIRYIPISIELAKYAMWSEYDGIETFTGYDMNNYKIDKIEELLKSTLSNDEFVLKIRDIMNRTCAEEKDYARSYIEENEIVEDEILENEIVENEILEN